MSGAIEIKDKNSNVRLALDGQGAAFTATISGRPLETLSVANPNIDGSYIYSRAEQTGAVAATNHMTIFNPASSGKTLALAGVFISSIVLADIGVATRSMRGYRITAASAGTLESASNIAKLQTSYPDPVGQIRYGNVTATLGPALFNSPPVIGASKTASPFVHAIPVPSTLGVFTLMEGEGIVLRTEAGDVDTLWNLSFAWAEL